MNNYIVTNHFNEKGTTMKNRKRILKKLVIAVITFAALTVPLAAQTGDESPKPVTFGIHLLGGGRYDDVRMCVGSPPGVPGGPIGEIYLDLRFAVGGKRAYSIEYAHIPTDFFRTRPENAPVRTSGHV